jgi:hypothetical protein
MGRKYTAREHPRGLTPLIFIQDAELGNDMVEGSRSLYYNLFIVRFIFLFHFVFPFY